MFDLAMPRRLALTALAAILVLSLAGAPARAQTLSIFFGVQSAELVPSAKPLLEMARGMLKPGGRITLAGNCDTAEKDADKLSLARAMAVQKMLVALGVPRGVSITVVGKATSALRIKTGPNTSEPQNRSVAVAVE
ncbi:MAG: OmpA family protein [Rhizobiales bacterium]|nr:OmpA family protein [Hyphomicrobiales bacterium]